MSNDAVRREQSLQPSADLAADRVADDAEFTPTGRPHGQAGVVIGRSRPIEACADELEEGVALIASFVV